METGNGNKVLVPFMGGNVVLKAGGEFTGDNGKLIQYDPCVDVSSIVDSKGRIAPANFVSMLEAVKDPKVVTALKALC